MIQKVSVCKTFFLNTLGISESVVRNVLKKDDTGGFAFQDMRGRHVPPIKLPDEVLNKVRSHINLFPCSESHYILEKNSKKYLRPELTKQKMFKLYLAKCEDERVPKTHIVKLWSYKTTLQTEFNLGLNLPSLTHVIAVTNLFCSLKNVAKMKKNHPSARNMMSIFKTLTKDTNIKD